MRQFPETRLRRQAWLTWTTWLAILAAGTLIMLWARARLGQAHVALTYLLVVLGASARGGRTLGLTIAVTAFVAFDVLFLPPFATLVVADPLDWLVLVAFLITSVVAAQLLYRAQQEAATAREHAGEVDRLATLGAETISLARAEDALAAIALVIRRTLAVDECEVFVVEEVATGTSTTDWGPPLARLAASTGQAVVERRDGTTSVAGGETFEAALVSTPEAVAALLPLIVRQRVVGVLRVADRAPLALDDARRRVLQALTYYAALGAERVRLAHGAEGAETLREADRMKDALLASVSHDLRTPLTTIKALAHGIRADGDERAAVIEAETDRLTRVVTDLLDLSRLQGGALRLDVQLTAADELLESVAQSVAGLPGADRLRMSLDSAEPLLVGRFDLVHSVRALSNLVANALAYGGGATPVDVTARRDGRWLAFAVADRGAGIPVAEHERIFEPFYRAPGTAPDARGSGLGLSIAQRLAEAQHGSVVVAPRDGGGSVFTLRVPAADIGGAADSL